jgi:cephalosporin-C deacetylase-like acetyl esterase
MMKSHIKTQQWLQVYHTSHLETFVSSKFLLPTINRGKAKMVMRWQYYKLIYCAFTDSVIMVIYKFVSIIPLYV